MQRSREFVVEQHELQQLPPSAMIVTYAAADGRHVVMVDANPAIMNLPTATLASLEEARGTPQEGIGPVPDRGPGPAEPGPAEPGPAESSRPGGRESTRHSGRMGRPGPGMVVTRRARVPVRTSPARTPCPAPIGFPGRSPPARTAVPAAAGGSP